MTRGLKVAGQLGALALVLGLLGLLIWKIASDDAPVASVGKPVPHFDLPTLSGDERVAIVDHVGKPMVINFWATWCVPCRTEAPLLERAAKRYDDRVVFIGVDVRDFNGDAKNFVEKHGLSYLIAYDGPAKLWEPWGITGLPETFFVDRNGTIIDHKVGEITDEADLDEAIRRTLS
ncbi:MAG: cytochrome c biosis protein CcmG, thiol:disulfide interchange protein DsbE [Gaiellaceae bacterium]|nr:cytochrome c biosis protein CcmG, thiol:disulfide interchange protein DsbE [Gaiellaceae bacterium]